jgi:hypothetical protein
MFIWAMRLISTTTQDALGDVVGIHHDMRWIDSKAA